MLRMQWLCSVLVSAATEDEALKLNMSIFRQSEIELKEPVMHILAAELHVHLNKSTG